MKSCLLRLLRFKGYLNEVGGKRVFRKQYDTNRFKGYLNEVGGKIGFNHYYIIIISLF